MDNFIELYRPWLRFFLCLSVCFALKTFISNEIKKAPQELADKIFLDNYNNVYRIRGMLGISGGTGVALIAKSGKKVVLTNRHVCLGTGDYVSMHNGNFGGQSAVLYKDLEADLCVIDFPSHIPVAEIPLSSKIARGNEIVHAVGFPLDHDKNLSSGLVLRPLSIEVFGPFKDQTNCNRVFEFNKNKVCAILENIVQTNIVAFPGNSGIPVFNNQNELIGLVSATDPRSNFAAMVLLVDIKRVLNKF